MLKPYQRDFIEFALKNGALRFGEFTLKSGRRSPYFFNTGLFNTGAKLAELGRFYAHCLVDHPVEYDMLFGPAYKGIPLVSTVSIALADHHQQDKPYCFDRKEVKDHGEGGITVGAPLSGRVIVVDDVISAGTSVGISQQIIHNAGATMVGVLIALDRQERGHESLSAVEEVHQRYHVPVMSIIQLKNIILYLEQHGNTQLQTYLPQVHAYYQQYGAR